MEFLYKPSTSVKYIPIPIKQPIPFSRPSNVNDGSKIEAKPKYKEDLQYNKSFLPMISMMGSGANANHGKSIQGTKSVSTTFFKHSESQVTINDKMNLHSSFSKALDDKKAKREIIYINSVNILPVEEDSPQSTERTIQTIIRTARPFTKGEKTRNKTVSSNKSSKLINKKHNTISQNHSPSRQISPKKQNNKVDAYRNSHLKAILLSKIQGKLEEQRKEILRELGKEKFEQKMPSLIAKSYDVSIQNTFRMGNEISPQRNPRKFYGWITNKAKQHSTSPQRGTIIQEPQIINSTKELSSSVIDKLISESTSKTKKINMIRVKNIQQYEKKNNSYIKEKGRQYFHILNTQKAVSAFKI